MTSWSQTTPCNVKGDYKKNGSTARLNATNEKTLKKYVGVLVENFDQYHTPFNYILALTKADN